LCDDLCRTVGNCVPRGGFRPGKCVGCRAGTRARDRAQFLKQAGHVGSLAADKQADIFIVNPSIDIRDVENVELVFKDGVAYDSKKLIESVKGQVGIR